MSHMDIQAILIHIFTITPNKYASTSACFSQVPALTEILLIIYAFEQFAKDYQINTDKTFNTDSRFHFIKLYGKINTDLKYKRFPKEFSLIHGYIKH